MESVRLTGISDCLVSVKGSSSYNWLLSFSYVEVVSVVFKITIQSNWLSLTLSLDPVVTTSFEWEFFLNFLTAGSRFGERWTFNSFNVKGRRRSIKVVSDSWYFDNSFEILIVLSKSINVSLDFIHLCLDFVSSEKHFFNNDFMELLELDNLLHQG